MIKALVRDSQPSHFFRKQFMSILAQYPLVDSIQLLRVFVDEVLVAFDSGFGAERGSHSRWRRLPSWAVIGQVSVGIRFVEARGGRGESSGCWQAHWLRLKLGGALAYCSLLQRSGEAGEGGHGS